MKNISITFSLLFFLISYITKAQTWEFVGLDSMIIYGLEVKGDTIWAGTRDVSTNAKSGLYKSIDRGQTWVKLDSLLGDKRVTSFSIDKDNNLQLFIIKGYNHAGYFYRTTDNGLSWDSISTPGGAPITDFIVSPISSDEYYVITYTIGHEWSTVELFHKSTDGGNSWEYKCCPGDQENGIVMTFAIDKTIPNTLYISGASAESFFNRSIDRGDTWQNLSGPKASRVFVDFILPNRIYLFNFFDKMYSDDGGVSWQNMSGEYSPDAKFVSFYQDPNTSVIYAMLNEGLFYSDNNNIFWKLIPGSEILPVYYSGNIINISTDNENNIIYVGSASGIYRTDFVTGVYDQETDGNPEEFYLSQNYPNPFNPTTTISYEIPKKSFITLKVYDILGKERKTLVEENQSAGQYEFKFFAGDLQSGVYFYVLTANSETGVQTKIAKKMILIK